MYPVAILGIGGVQFNKLASSIALFIGGVWLLSLRISGWSLIFGLPAVQIGIILIILSFDRSSKKNLGVQNYHIIYCSKCKNPIAVPKNEKVGFCDNCKKA